MNAFLSTWYGTVALFAVLGAIYLCLGAYISGRIADRDDGYPGNDDASYILPALLWPLAVVCILGYYIFQAARKPFALGASYTERKNKRKGIEPPVLRGKVMPAEPYDYEKDIASVRHFGD